MSNVSEKIAVDNTLLGTNGYTPLVETGVNAVQLITAGLPKKGRVDIFVKCSSQQELEGSCP